MALYCVVISGRLPGDIEDSAVWAPIAKGFKLDGDAFAERVLSRLPLIVKQGLDQVAATTLAEQLRSACVDAKSLPDDTKLVLLERDGQVKGPIPYSSLGDFVQVGERYRLRSDAEWSVWTGNVGSIEPDSPPFSLDEPPSLEVIAPVKVQTEQEADSPSPDSHKQAIPVDEPPPFPGEDVAPPASASWSGWVPPEPDFTSYDERPPPFPGEVAQTDPGPWDQPRNAASAGGIPFIEEPPPVTTSRVDAPAEPLQRMQGTVIDGHGAGQMHSPSHKSRVLILGVVSLGVIVLGVAGYLVASRHQSPVSQAVQSPSMANAASSSQQVPTAPKVQTSAPVPPRAQQAPSTQPQPQFQPANSGGASVADTCSADAPSPSSPEEKELVANGDRYLTGKATRGGVTGQTYVVEAALGYDGQCRPDPYQIYVFHDQKLVGTVVPNAMHARSDGDITDFKLLDAQHLQVDVAHYGPDAPACCASSTETRVIDIGKLWGAVASQETLGKSASPSPTHPGVQPSFDCQKAESPTEKAICSNGTLSRLDAAMGQAYHTTLSQLSGQEAVALKDNQRQWIGERAQRCGADSRCIAQSLKGRISLLRRDAANAVAERHQAQLEQGKLDAANECFKAANYDCSIQIATYLLNANPGDAKASDLLHRSRQAQSKALQGNWNIH